MISCPFHQNFLMPSNGIKNIKQLYLVFSLQLLDFVNKEDQLVNVAPDINAMNASFSELINSYKRSYISAHDMSFANDTIRLPVKPMNSHNETNNRIKSIIEQKKGNKIHLLIL